MKIQKPLPGTFPPYFNTYISKVQSDNLVDELLTVHYDTIDLITSIDLETQHFRYAEGKWNIKEIIQHIMDTERIFSYRALCIARGDETSLPGFDENKYAAHSYATSRNMNDIAREFSVLRASTIELIKSFNDEAWSKTGTANAHAVSLPALFYVILGHEIHHIQIINERYLPQ
ncbi:MAG: DinB family protein [Bacteroidota bacterium]|jgi:uncharacterized damage-inducible protein DinB